MSTSTYNGSLFLEEKKVIDKNNYVQRNVFTEGASNYQWKKNLYENHILVKHTTDKTLSSEVRSTNN